MSVFDVVLTTYCRPEFAVAAVQSCLAQGPLLNHVIVVDDASGDDTGARLKALADERVRYHARPENGGPGMARHDGLRLATAPWVVLLDSDWTLKPHALNELHRVAQASPRNTVMVGSRIEWEDGRIIPPVVPTTPITYADHVRWRGNPASIWQDNLVAISRDALQTVHWPAYRVSWHAATLFFLDLARVGSTVYSAESLAIQKIGAPFSDSRGTRRELFDRRMLDAVSAVEVCELLLDRHGDTMAAHAPTLLASILRSCSMYALLTNQRRLGWAWWLRSVQLNGFSVRHAAIAVGLIAGTRCFRAMFLAAPGRS